MEQQSGVAFNFLEDNEVTSFGATSNSHSLNFDSFFDLDTDYPRLDASDASTSHGSTSTDTNFFDDLDSEAPFLDNASTTAHVDSPCIAATVRPSWLSSTFIPAVPRSRRLVYRLRPESVTITGAQLIALENKDNPHIVLPYTTLRPPLPATFSNTPPATPYQNRVQSSTLSRKQTCHKHQANREPSHPYSVHGSVHMSDSSKAILLTEAEYGQRQTGIPTPYFAESTEGLHHLTGHSLQQPPSLPISPPSSNRIDQTEISRNVYQSLGLEMEDNVFEPSSSTTTAYSSEPVHPFLDDTSPSTANSSPWNVNAAAELFGLKQDPWDFPTTHLEDISSEPVTDNLKRLARRHKRSTVMCCNPLSTTPNDDGLGISFGNDDLSSNPFKATPTPNKPALEFRTDSHPKPDSIKLPAMPFNTPTSEFCSPALSSDLPIMSPDIALTPSPPMRSSKPAHTMYKHRRTKSTPTLQSITRRISTGKPRTPKTSKEKSSAASGLGFVNYTPEDRTRILTGVAPSGSSKTRARREKEALERRRKLSEAAKRLVVEAGGDADAVDRELSD